MSLSFKTNINYNFDRIRKYNIHPILGSQLIFRINVLPNLWANYEFINLQKNFLNAERGRNLAWPVHYPLTKNRRKIYPYPTNFVEGVYVQKVSFCPQKKIFWGQ